MAVRFSLSPSVRAAARPRGGAGGRSRSALRRGWRPMPADTPGVLRRRASSALPPAPADGVLVRWTLRRTATPRRGRAGRPARRSGCTTDRGRPRPPMSRCACPIRAGDQIGLHQFGRRCRQRASTADAARQRRHRARRRRRRLGDETQDACPVEASLHVAPCHADIALTMSGPAFGVVDRDTPYDVTVVNRGPSAAAGVTAHRRRSPPGRGSCAPREPATCTPGATVRCTLPADRARRRAARSPSCWRARAEGASFHHAVERDDDEHRPHAGRPQRVGRHARHRRERRAAAAHAPGGAPCANPSFGGRDDDVLLRQQLRRPHVRPPGRATCCAGAPATTACAAARAPTCSTATAATTALGRRRPRPALRRQRATIACYGGAKGDELHGDTGNDQLFPGTGRDRVWGGAGNDTISARDGSRDVIDCGAGLDRVTADRARPSARLRAGDPAIVFAAG